MIEGICCFLFFFFHLSSSFLKKFIFYDRKVNTFYFFFRFESPLIAKKWRWVKGVQHQQQRNENSKIQKLTKKTWNWFKKRNLIYSPTSTYDDKKINNLNKLKLKTNFSNYKKNFLFFDFNCLHSIESQQRRHCFS